MNVRYSAAAFDFGEYVITLSPCAGASAMLTLVLMQLLVDPGVQLLRNDVGKVLHVPVSVSLGLYLFSSIPPTVRSLL